MENLLKDWVGAALKNCKDKQDVEILRDMWVRRCNDDTEFNQMIPERLK